MNYISKSTVFKLFLVLGFVILLATNSLSQNDFESAKDCKPEVSSLGKSMRVDRTISFGTLYASCIWIPENQNPKNLFNPYEGEKLFTHLKDSRGRIINSYVWYGEKYLKSVKMTRYEVVGGVEALKNLSVGLYTLDFAVGNDVFYTFPFSIKIRESNDPYNPGLVYMTEATFRDNATLFAAGKKAVFNLNFWLRDTDMKAEKKPRSVPFAGRIIRLKDRQTIAESGISSLILNNDWTVVSIYFREPETDETLKLDKITSVNGKYRMELELDSEPYANYEFEVKNGTINGKELPERRISVSFPANILIWKSGKK